MAADILLICLFFIFHSCRPIISRGSTKTIRHIVRPTTPKSSIPTVSAFDSIEDSDGEEDLVPDAKNDNAYLAPSSAILSIRSLNK
jgi:AMP deaminase